MVGIEPSAMQILSYILLEEILVRKSNGEIWVQHVLDCLSSSFAVSRRSANAI